MDLEILKQKKEDCRSWKNVQPWYNQLLKVFELEKGNVKIDHGDWFSVGRRENLTDQEFALIEETAKKS